MSLKKRLKKVLKSSPAGEVVFFYIRILREKLSFILTDEKFLKIRYKKKYGKKLDLVSPKDYGEVGAWLKLFYRDERMIRCADKYGIREYLSEIGYDGLCNEVIGVYDDAKKSILILCLTNLLQKQHMAVAGI